MKLLLVATLLAADCTGLRHPAALQRATAQMRRIVHELTLVGLVPVTREQLNMLLPKNDGSRSSVPQVIDSITVQDALWESGVEGCFAYFSLTSSDELSTFHEVRLRCSMPSRSEAVRITTEWLHEISPALGDELRTASVSASGKSHHQFKLVRDGRSVYIEVLIEQGQRGWDIAMDLDDEPPPVAVVGSGNVVQVIVGCRGVSPTRT